MTPRDRYVHWSEGLVSIIIPVLELKRRRRLRHPLAARRNVGDLLGDLEASVGVEIEVIVVCNSRERELVELVTGHERVDRYCLNSVNAGVARSWNIGAMLAEGEFLCFINDDVELSPGSVAGLKKAMDDDASVGQAGPRGALWPGVEPGPYVGEETAEKADAISGYCFMTRRSIFDQVGGFDVSFTPAGCEEIDYSFAVNAVGYDCLVVPGLGIEHHGALGVSSRDGRIGFLGHEVITSQLAGRNMDILKRKWSRP